MEDVAAAEPRHLELLRPQLRRDADVVVDLSAVTYPGSLGLSDTREAVLAKPGSKVNSLNCFQSRATASRTAPPSTAMTTTSRARSAAAWPNKKESRPALPAPDAGKDNQRNIITTHAAAPSENWLALPAEMQPPSIADWSPSRSAR